ncbi:hypothetical protein DPMN_100723 [Dreissena polymorpha]|uniref:Uncharacterized protein n=1 Tax=Dreissena polymorpha TaxID=45954 RepID=A0A9D4R7P5_DREPO|nr:hypothetical protein DPMN_100723 [Dreissena polymorpha]
MGHDLRDCKIKYPPFDLLRRYGDHNVHSDHRSSQPCWHKPRSDHERFVHRATDHTC